MTTPAIETSGKPVQGASVFARMKAVLRERPDSEHEMTLNRLVNNLVVLIYFGIASYFHVSEGEALLAQTWHLFVAYNLASILLFAHILKFPGVSVPRRLFAMCMDLSMICYVMHVGNGATALLYPFILWTIFGNGFRFGRKYLLLATAISLAEFGGVIATTEFWQEHPALSTGLVIGLIILPAYVSVLIRKLSEARDQAEAANRAKSMFLASISHELRTPLTAIIGLSELLRDTKLNSEQADMNETIGQSGSALLHLINSILDLSRLEVGKMPKTPQDLDLHRLLHRVADMISVPGRMKGVDVSLFIAPDVPRQILISPKHIEDSIINLASNAIKFTEKGHVRIAAHAVQLADGKPGLRLEVADSGIGISPEAQGRIFERFTQADDTIINKFGGTGLGLATVKQMIEDIGGHVGVASVTGEGSRFWIEAPFEAASVAAESADWKRQAVAVVSGDLIVHALLEAAGAAPEVFETVSGALESVRGAYEATGRRTLVLVDGRIAGDDLAAVAPLFRDACKGHVRLAAICENEASAGPALAAAGFATTIVRPLTADNVARALVAAAGPRNTAAEEDETPVENGVSYRVLLADDNKTNQKVIGKVLERAGHRVTVADNGQVAVTLLQEQPFDIALFDVNMPVLNGIDAAKLYQFASLGGRQVPIVALTADATPETDAKCREAGMRDCLLKPIEPKKLNAAIARIVGAGAIEVAEERQAGDNQSTSVAMGASAHDPVNAAALNDLIELGGKEFALEVVLQFVADGAKVMLDLVQAVAEDDAARFAELVHALRSGAANVGAQRIFELCHDWRSISASEIATSGDEYLDTLKREFEHASAELQRYLTAPPKPAAAKLAARQFEEAKGQVA